MSLELDFMDRDPQLKTPRLRGYFHQEAFFVALGACILLIARCSTPTALIECLIYTFGLLILLGTSALYHRVYWPPRTRKILKQADHSAIYLLIAGTTTPVCGLALSPHDGRKLLTLVWIAALIGILKSAFWENAPKPLSAALYVVVGWLAVPYLTELARGLGPTNFSMLVAGGLAYTVGALVYAVRRPNLRPDLFGYHELFHLLTIVGAALHFAVIYQLVK